eukprot:scaffold113532_cov17-Tisochrysis_lutea.AAC.3
MGCRNVMEAVCTGMQSECEYVACRAAMQPKVHCGGGQYTAEQHKQTGHCTAGIKPPQQHQEAVSWSREESLHLPGITEVVQHNVFFGVEETAPQKIPAYVFALATRGPLRWHAGVNAL